MRKYIASGLSREAVPLAVANFGDDPIKVIIPSSTFFLISCTLNLIRDVTGHGQVRSISIN